MTYGSLPNYDAWKLASPPEPDEVDLYCPECEATVHTFVMHGEAECDAGHLFALPTEWDDEPDDDFGDDLEDDR